MYDDFYSALEQGRIEPTTFWESYVSKWDEMKQTAFCIRLLGIVTKEEREGRYGSNLHRYALYLYDSLSRECNYQRQKEQGLQAPYTDADEVELPEILKHPEIKKDFDKAIEIGLLVDYYTLKASKMLLACFCWGICKQYDIGTIAKSGENKGGFAANWIHFAFIKDANGKDIDLKQGWQNAKTKNCTPQKLSGFAFWETLCKELDISE